MSHGGAMIEKIDVIQSGTAGVVTIQTESESMIHVSASNGITLKGFLGYTEEEKLSWELHDSTFGLRRNFICLVVPHKTLPGAMWFPLVQCSEHDVVTLAFLPSVVQKLRSVLERELPAGETDEV